MSILDRSCEPGSIRSLSSFYTYCQAEYTLDKCVLCWLIAFGSASLVLDTSQC